MKKPIPAQDSKNWLQWLRSLPVKISLIQLVIAMVLILLTWWTMLSVQKQQLMSHELTVNRHLGQLIVARLHEVTAQVNSLVTSMASLGELAHSEPSKLENVVPALLDLESQKHLITGGGIWPASIGMLNGQSLFWARDNKQQLILQNGYNNPDTVDYQSQFWYQPTRILPKGKTLWSKAYQDPITRETMVTASAPMWFDHTFLGATTVDISLEHLNEYVDQGKSDKPGYVLVIDPYNQVIAAPPGFTSNLPVNLANYVDSHPRFNSLWQKLSATNAQPPSPGAHSFNQGPADSLSQMEDTAARTTSYLITNLSAGWPSSPLELDSFTLDHDPLLGEQVMTSVFLMPDTLWQVVIVTPINALGEEAQGIAGQVGIILLLVQFIALTMLFWVLHRVLVSPLSRMAQALYQDRPEQLEIEASQRKDEIGKLAAAFVSRQQQLETALASLEANHVALEQQLAVQQEAKLELSRYRDLLQALMESSPNMIFVKDLQGVYLMVNPKYCQVTMREQRQILGHTDPELYPDGDADRFKANDELALNSTEAVTFDEILTDHQGERWFKVTKFAIRNAREEVIAIGGIGYEVVRKGAERLG